MRSSSASGAAADIRRRRPRPADLRPRQGCVADRRPPARAARGPRRDRRARAVVHRPQRPHAGLRRERLAALIREHILVSRPTARHSSRDREPGRRSRSVPGRAARTAEPGDAVATHDLVLTSPKNPRVRAAAELRDRRARDEAGLHDRRRRARARPGARRAAPRSRRCSWTTAASTPAGHETVARASAAGADDHRRSAPPCSPGSRTATAPRGSWRSSRSRTWRSPALDLAGRTRSSSSLEGVEKPGNLGAVLRSADAAGADAVIVADPRTDLFNPNAIRASLGTIFAPAGRGRARAPRSGPGCDERQIARARRPRRVDASRTRKPTSGAPSPSSSARRRTGSRTPGRATGSPRSRCRCTASPTASTCRSRPRSCCTRHAASAA